MSINDSRARLRRATDDLLMNWRHACATWRDEKRNQFERSYISVLQAESRKTEQALDRIGALLNEARRDCG